MGKKIGAVTVGTISMVVIIFTGYKSFTDTSGYLTVAYGLVTAVLAPVAISFIQWSFKKPDKTLEELKKIPAIQQLLDEVRQGESRIQELEDERNKLIEIIQKESRLFMLQERKAALETSIANTQKELLEIDGLLACEPNEEFKYLPEVINEIKSENQEPRPNLELRILDAFALVFDPTYFFLEIAATAFGKLLGSFDRLVVLLFKSLFCRRK